MKKAPGKIVLLLLALGLGFGFWSQSRTNAALRDERRHLREQSAELSRLEEKRNQLQAALLDGPDLEKLKTDAEKASQLRQQNEKNKAALAKISGTPTTQPSNTPPDQPANWRNAGQATPADTLQSVIWAATNGDVDSLMPMIAFDVETRAAAEAFLQSQSDSIRAQYPTIEKLVATIMSGSISTGLRKAELLKQTEAGPHLVTTTFALHTVSKGSTANQSVSARPVTFWFQQIGDEWKLLVPASAIEGYKKMLQQP